MDSGFFGAPERAFGFAFHGFPLDRVAERRDDKAFLSGLNARGDAEVILIGREMPVLTAGRAAPDPLSLRRTRPARRRGARGAAWTC